MRKLFRNFGLVSLICFSFYFTEKTRTVVKETDALMQEITTKAPGYEILPVEATIHENQIIPGLLGKQVNISKSYDQMKQIGAFEESQLVYQDVYPNNRLVNHLNHYVIAGNANKNMVSILFVIDNETTLAQIRQVASQYQVSMTFFVDGVFAEESEASLSTLVKEEHILGNAGYGLDYQNSSFVWLDTIIKKYQKSTYGFCLNQTKNENDMKICALHQDHTIYPNIIIKSNPLTEIKEQLISGSIILYPNQTKMIKQLGAVIQYIQSKGYQIVNLATLLEE